MLKDFVFVFLEPSEMYADQSLIAIGAKKNCEKFVSKDQNELPET